MAIVVCIIWSQRSHMDRYNVPLIDDCYCLVSYMSMWHETSATEYIYKWLLRNTFLKHNGKFVQASEMKEMADTHQEVTCVYLHG